MGAILGASLFSGLVAIFATVVVALSINGELKVSRENRPSGRIHVLSLAVFGVAAR